MKTCYKIGWILLFCGSIVSCKKFLAVKPIDVLAGNNFWQTQEDAQKAVNGAYRELEGKFLASTLYNDGDFRAGNWNWFNKRNLAALGRNDLANHGELDASDNTGDPSETWKTFYQAIATANLCIERIPDVADPSFSEAAKQQLIAEAKFIRCFTYFYMVRLYGDVPLQNDPYNTENKPRINMLTVLDTCLHDLADCRDNLPVKYDDPTNRAVRATKGAALTLMANIYMWKAGFDQPHQKEYWQQAADLAKEVMDLGVYKLLPYTDVESFQTIFKGRSEEGIFELSLDINYGIQFHSLICQWTLHEPIIHSSTNLYGGYGSEITPQVAFLDQLYPAGQPDKRFDLWFDDPYSKANPQSAMFLKFSAVSNPSTRDYDANFILFRYAGLILLRAEALADLDQSGEAVKLLNLIRQRAGAQDYVGGGGVALQDAIFLEREKELMGEGWRWYDLVRTGRVMDKTWCEDFLTAEEFREDAWTWPIPTTASSNNPLIQQNDYWSR